MSKERAEYKSKFITFIECVTERQMPNTEEEIHAHHDGAEIYEFLDGKLYFAADGEQIEIERGDLVIINDGVLHRPIIKESCYYHRRRITVKNDFFLSRAEGGIELKRRLDERRVIKLGSNNTARTECAQLIDRIKDYTSSGTEYAAFCAETAVQSLLIRAVEEMPYTTPHACRQADARVRELIRYIDENISGELCYRALADTLHVSEKNLYKLFKAKTGFTLSRYVRERRVIIAKARLNAGASPSEAALASGFADYSTFYRTFLASVGITPTEYVMKNK